MRRSRSISIFCGGPAAEAELSAAHYIGSMSPVPCFYDRTSRIDTKIMTKYDVDGKVCTFL